MSLVPVRRLAISNIASSPLISKTKTDQTLRYVAVISHGKAPGQLESEDGVGNAEFNAGLTESKFAYEIEELYELREPLALVEMQKTYGVTFPQRYSYAPESLLEAVILNEQRQIF